MKKELFEEPIVEVIEFKIDAILTGSNNGDENDLPTDEW